jgi:hypothetical protein
MYASCQNETSAPIARQSVAGLFALQAFDFGADRPERPIFVLAFAEMIGVGP